MESQEAGADEIQTLRRAMRDLVALSALPALWIGHEPRQVAESLADVLANALHLDLLYIRLHGGGEAALEAARAPGRADVAGQAAAIGAALARWLEAGDPAPVVPNPLGEGTLRLATVPIGIGGESGILAAGSRRPDFPRETDRLLLGIGANQVATLLRASFLSAALAETNRRKDEFLATLAHELRNPLAPIRNAVEVLTRKGPPDPELQWARDVIERQVRQMSRLVDDLLDVSRITRGQLELRRERVELAEVVNSALESSRPLIAACGHELTVELPPCPVYLDADLTRLAQALLNLLNNAAKYTEPGGRIGLTAELAEGAGPVPGEVVVRVWDTGVGIPAEMLPRVFELFTQVDGSLERAQGGLGIGLTLVRRLVEMHGGTVEAESAGPGRGSAFVLRLPVAAAEAESGEAPGRDRTEAAAVLAERRILVVDDNRDSAESLSLLLEMSGAETRTAFDGPSAVEEAAAFHPDVVLLDIGLPGMNGYEVARRIRAEQLRDVVLIALTGWGQEEDRRLSREAGFDHHLVKPVELGALRTLLASLG